jgi:hypothetical protein
MGTAALEMFRSDGQTANIVESTVLATQEVVSVVFGNPAPR